MHFMHISHHLLKCKPHSDKIYGATGKKRHQGVKLVGSKCRPISIADAYADTWIEYRKGPVSALPFDTRPFRRLEPDWFPTWPSCSVKLIRNLNSSVAILRIGGQCWRVSPFRRTSYDAKAVPIRLEVYELRQGRKVDASRHSDLLWTNYRETDEIGENLKTPTMAFSVEERSNRRPRRTR